MKDICSKYKLKWGAFVFFSSINNDVVIGKPTSLSLYRKDCTELALSSGFQYANIAVESQRHSNIFVANPLNQILSIKCAPYSSRVIKHAAGEFIEAFLSIDEDYAVFVSATRNVLLLDIKSCEEVATFSFTAAFGNYTTIKFIREILPVRGYEFAVWMIGSSKPAIITLDLLNNSYIDSKNPALMIMHKDKYISSVKYIPEFDCYILLFDEVDYVHVKMIVLENEVFSFNTSYEVWSQLKVFHRKAHEAYICLTLETIVLFDFITFQIRKIYRCPHCDLRVVAYDKKADELTIIHAFEPSVIITIDDFCNFSGFDA